MTSHADLSTQVPLTEDPNTQLRDVSPGSKRALVTGYTAFYIDMVALYLPLIALPPALIYFQPPGMSPAQNNLFFFLTFGAALISRPIGSMVFGQLADRLGRRKITMVAIAGFSVVTLLMGLLPGYEQIGIAGYILLIVLRLFDGVFLGGEYSATTPLAFEACPRNKRGFYSGILETGYSLGYITIAALTLIVLNLVPAGDLQSPYVQWGWRIPFFVGALLGLAFLIFRSKVPESTVWENSERAKSPLRDVLFGPQKKDTYQVLLLTTGFWLSTSAVVSVVPSLLQNEFEVSNSTSILTMIVAQSLLIVSFLILGPVSQKVGRRRFIAWSTTIMAVICIPLYIFLSAGGTGNLGMLLFLAVVVTVVNGAIWAPLPAYLVERFPAAQRASGYGVGYSVGLIVPGFYSFYMLGLDNFMPYEFTQIPLLALGAVLIVVGVLIGPETSKTSFATDAQTSERTEKNAS